MSQTILYDYIAAITVDVDELLCDEDLPSPRPFGFSSIAQMLVEAQNVMMALGETVSEHERIVSVKAAEIERLSLILNTLRGCLDNAVECLCMDPPTEDDEDDPDCHAGYCPVYMWSLLENWRTLQVKSNNLSE